MKFSFFAKKTKVIPVEPIKLCLMCLEDGATKRPCCNALFCDFCYTKNQLCPNCQTATKKEKMTGAVFMVNAFSEHEECRVCLNPGLKRRCCGNYYCDECYYKQPLCRSCKAPVGQKAESIFDSARIIPILLGFVVTIFVSTLIGGGTFLALLNDNLTPVGVNGYLCYGFFPKCDVDVCIDISPATANGSQPMPPLHTYRNCTLNSQSKIYTKACVFDRVLYEETKGLYGYDLCYKEYSGAVVIFEDTFDEWKNVSFRSNKMKSAHWSRIINGRSNNWCGSLSGKKALSFAGYETRYAELAELDLSNGGWLEAYLFLAPMGYDFTHIDCPTNYAGAVHVEYSVNQGFNWTILQRFDPVIYRQNSYFYVRYDFPADIKYNDTRFRFIQPYFNDYGDGWAIDNIRVYRYLPKGWHESDGFNQTVRKGHEGLQEVQCCFDTEWCESRFSTDKMNSCSSDYPTFKAGIYNIRATEIFVAVAALIGFVKAVYVGWKDLLMTKRYPFQDEMEDAAKYDRLMKYLPPRWRPKKNLEDYMKNIHKSARLEADMRAQFMDEEGKGEMAKTDDEIKAEKVKEKLKVRRKKERRLKDIQKKRKEDKETMQSREELMLIAELSKPDSDDETEGDEMVKLKKEIETKFGTDAVATKKDKLKRQDIAKLRTPFDPKVDLTLRYRLTVVPCGIMAIVTLFRITTTNYYEIFQKTNPYGLYESQVVLTSFLINLMAIIMDGKEIYHCLKYVFAVRDEWVPPITFDTSEEVRAMFVGRHTIPLENVLGIKPFSPLYIQMLIAAHLFAIVPWCQIMLILRDQHVSYAALRILTPIFGSFIIAKALFGPAFVAKIFFGFTYLYSLDLYVREDIGRAFQHSRTFSGSYFAGIIFCASATFFGSALVGIGVIPYLAAASLVFGAVYGAGSGCYHSLPIRPWMYLTCIEEGVAVRVRKKTACPCKKTCIHCTEIHETDEIFVIFPKDPVPFMNLLRGSSAA